MLMEACGDQPKVLLKNFESISDLQGENPGYCFPLRVDLQGPDLQVLTIRPHLTPF